MGQLRLVIWIAALLAGATMLAAHAIGQDRAAGIAYSIELPGTIDPATERWIGKALGEAEDRGAELAIIRIDTPGGLDTSTRSIVRDIIAAPLPVVAYVSPDGARAASAGLFITQSADVAAMAPQTNIGSATPVQIGPAGDDQDEETVLGRKIENDAAAYVRALAEGHDRNGDLAELMVTDAENVTASEALEENLIDVVAANEEDLLEQLDGYEVRGPKEQTLDTEGLVIERRDMTFQFNLLQILVNPNMAFLLLLVGLAGIAFEVFNPGLIFPGALGVVALLLGFYGTAQLPVTAAGIALLALGIGMIVGETQLPTSGVLGGVGVASLALGGLLLFDTGEPGFGISPAVVIAVAIMVGGFLVFAMHKVSQAHKLPVHTGWEELVSFEGEVRLPVDPIGQVFVDGGLWRATPADGVEGEDAKRLRERGVRVRVEAVEGLTLRVRPLASDDEEED
jgi:membrane-bound serine protease (ClpP class)